jgi:aerobic carbon-monoxide dehydrogenase medium subunit
MLPFSIKKRVLRAYYFASSVQEALAYLMAHQGEAQLIAGGTYLMPEVQRGCCGATQLVDISRIGALKRIELEDGRMVLGGATTFARLLSCEQVAASAPLIHRAAELMGTPAVRHLATLGGNVASAQANAEGGVALVALDAEAEITNITGSQWLPVESLFVRPGLSRINSSSEIITSLRFHAHAPGHGVALERIEVASCQERSPLVLALIVGLGPDRRAIAWASVVVGVAGRMPTHLLAAEKALRGADTTLDETRAALLSALMAYLGGDVSSKPPAWYAQVPELAGRAYDRALAMAQ